MSLTAIALNATLKRSGGEPSSTDRMIGLIGDALLNRTRTVMAGLSLAEGPG